MAVYFNHIPKTAGTSLRHSLSRLFGRARCNTDWFFDDYLKCSQDRLMSFDFVAGHFGGYPPKIHPRSLSPITFVRDPVARSYSHFLHIRNDKTHPIGRLVRQMSFSDFIHSEFSEFELLSFQSRCIGLESINDYVAFLACAGNRARVIDMLRSKALRERSISRLCGYSFVGVCESYSLSVDCLSKYLGVPIENDACLNTAKSSDPIPEMSDYDRDRLAWLNEFDNDMYVIAGDINLQLQNVHGRKDFRTMELKSSHFSRHIDLEAPWVGGGWGAIELFGGSSYCWSSSLNPWLAFIAEPAVKHALVVRLATYNSASIEKLTVTANGEPVRFESVSCIESDGNFFYISAVLPPDLSYSNGLLEIRFGVPETVNPKRDLGLDDDRDLGLYLNWARLVPCR
jgi:hypothetical protein